MVFKVGDDVGLMGCGAVGDVGGTFVGDCLGLEIGNIVDDVGETVG